MWMNNNTVFDENIFVFPHFCAYREREIFLLRIICSIANFEYQWIWIYIGTNKIIINLFNSVQYCKPFLSSICSIAPAANGIVRKRISSVTDSEAIAYRGISRDAYASKIVPKFMGVQEVNGETFLELQDLLHGFKDPTVMDIKMGCRTFLESEVTNTTLRADLYNKMVAVDPTAPTAEEHQCKAVTKLRYMLFREQMSSSQSKGFRIEALKMKGSSPITDLKKVKNSSDIYATISHFLNGRRSITKDLIKRLKQIRTYVEKSSFFQAHEIVGSSIFIVYDDEKAGVWLIDFAKARKLPEHIQVTHRKQWMPGNCEEGLLHGIDELINVFEEVVSTQSAISKFSSKKLFIRRWKTRK